MSKPVPEPISREVFHYSGVSAQQTRYEWTVIECMYKDFLLFTCHMKIGTALEWVATECMAGHVQQKINEGWTLRSIDGDSAYLVKLGEIDA